MVSDFDRWMNKNFPKGGEQPPSGSQEQFKNASSSAPAASPPSSPSTQQQPLISGSNNVGVVTGSQGTGLHPDDDLHTDPWDNFRPGGRSF